ncbi:uncharacterized protein LOC143905987 [Temnothorax americanus]|uniref:uncharacterized protein LOC143905987 n=1 Tax=Temnothorax americanus TaxID=1964332 RepID=UPI00406939F0
MESKNKKLSTREMAKTRKEKILEVKTRCVSFDKEKMFNLISIYSLPAIQNEFKKSKRHSLMYKKIAILHNMSEKYCRNAKDIRTKIKNLRSKYIKKKPKSEGTPPDDFPFYDVLHKLWSEKDIFKMNFLMVQWLMIILMITAAMKTPKVKNY